MATIHNIPFLFLSGMDYQQTLDYLFNRLPMFSRIGAAAYKEDLTNTIELCNALGNPQKKFKSIHIAGTNGKGSVSHMLAAILQTAGYKTGLYTSPHLKDFRERIKINGEEISEDFVVAFTKEISPIIEKIEPSFFEITVAMAFAYFAQEKVDIAIIETGLGGRLDSTNIISPELSIITNIGMDHMQFLGDTIEKIATEKAGIIKPGIPVVIGETNQVTLPVFERIAKEKKAALCHADNKRMIADYKWEKNELIVEVATEHSTDHKVYHLDLTGIYQLKNILSVIESCFQLQRKGWKISEQHIKEGLQHTKKLTGLHGRWETLHSSPKVIVDVAHNVEGVRQLIRQIEITTHKNLHLIIGLAADKEINEILEILPTYAIYYFTKAQIPRAIAEDDLKKFGNQTGLRGNAYPEVNSAIETAISKSDKDDLIIIFGSIFLAGEIAYQFK